ncbi:MAG: UPF0280 family protein [Microvirga sp.]|jgi:ApbE superfamily uncharacterized protein (UPF0280 family)
MFAGAAMQSLAGDRLHLSHGPIDVVLRAWGAEVEVRRAHEAVVARFKTVLAELAGELDALRRPIADEPRVEGPVARRMVAAVRPFAPEFITPMAAVAGSVADELLAAMLAAAVLEKAFVNDGGDIAIHLSPGERLAVGIAGDFSGRAVPALNGAVILRDEDGIGGIATSGFNGRSFTLGIADSVTVVAASAAAADAAATVVANAVDLDSPAIERRPASALDPDSDLGDRLVTSAVGPLTEAEIRQALTNGRSRAERLIARGLIGGVALMLRGQNLVAAAPALAARLASRARDP